MIVASYDTEKNQQINCNCKQFKVDLKYIKSWKEIETDVIVFCVDRQAREEELKGHVVFDLENYEFPIKEFTLVFGKNHGMKIGKEIIDAKSFEKEVEVVNIPGKVLWAESAMAIMLYKFENRF